MSLTLQFFKVIPKGLESRKLIFSYSVMFVVLFLQHHYFLLFYIVIKKTFNCGLSLPHCPIKSQILD